MIEHVLITGGDRIERRHRGLAALHDYSPIWHAVGATLPDLLRGACSAIEHVVERDADTTALSDAGVYVEDPFPVYSTPQQIRDLSYALAYGRPAGIKVVVTCEEIACFPPGLRDQIDCTVSCEDTARTALS